MLLVDYFQFNFFLNIIILTSPLYIVFLKINNHKNVKYVNTVCTKINNIKLQPIIFYIRLGVCIFILLLMHINLYRGFTNLLFWDNIFISNTGVFLYNVIIIFALVLLIILNIILKFDRELKSGFFFAFFNIAI
jgi:hypothetical protein